MMFKQVEKKEIPFMHLSQIGSSFTSLQGTAKFRRELDNKLRTPFGRLYEEMTLDNGLFNDLTRAYNIEQYIQFTWQ